MVNVKQAKYREKLISKLTCASSVGDFVDIRGFASVVDTANASTAVSARQTVLRTFYIRRHSSSRILPL